MCPSGKPILLVYACPGEETSLLEGKPTPPSLHMLCSNTYCVQMLDAGVVPNNQALLPSDPTP